MNAEDPPSSIDNNQLYSPSEEYRIFWGNSLSPSWFKPKSPISGIHITLILMLLLVLYLCSQLLFTPQELFQFAFEKNELVVDQAKIEKLVKKYK